MQQFKEMIQEVMNDRVDRNNDRTGVGRVSTFGVTKVYKNVEEKFPLLTLKKTNFNFIKDELLWFLSGSNNINDLQESTRMIWKDWTDTTGSIGKSYGYQFRRTNVLTNDKKNKTVVIDQLNELIDNIKNNPQSSRLMINLWNVSELSEMNLPPCLFNYQFLVDTNRKELNLVISQRSGDLMLGIPFNIASASLFLMLVAKTCDLKANKLIHNIGDLHIYKNHLEFVDEILHNTEYDLPTVKINKRDRITDYTLDDIQLIGYQSNKFYKMPLAV